MRGFKIGTVKVWITKKGIEESRVHFRVRSGKATLSAEEFRIFMNG